MTPNRRLDQLEPLMADSLQKIDRLIEGQGQIIDVATRADSNAETAARGVANLTVTVQQGFTDIRGDAADIRGDVAELNLGQTRLEAGQIRFEDSQSRLETNQTGIGSDVTELKAGQGRLEAAQVRLEANQQEILTLLRDRLP